MLCLRGADLSLSVMFIEFQITTGLFFVRTPATRPLKSKYYALADTWVSFGHSQAPPMVLALPRQLRSLNTEKKSECRASMRLVLLLKRALGESDLSCSGRKERARLEARSARSFPATTSSEDLSVSPAIADTRLEEDAVAAVAGPISAAARCTAISAVVRDSVHLQPCLLFLFFLCVFSSHSLCLSRAPGFCSGSPSARGLAP